MFLSPSRRSPNQNLLQSPLPNQLRRVRRRKRPRPLRRHLRRPRHPNLQPQVFRAPAITRLLLLREWVAPLPVARLKVLDLVVLSIEMEAPGLPSSHGLVALAAGQVGPVLVAPAAVLVVVPEVAQVGAPALVDEVAVLVVVPLVLLVAVAARANPASRSARSVKSLRCGRRRV